MSSVDEFGCFITAFLLEGSKECCYEQSLLLLDKAVNDGMAFPDSIEDDLFLFYSTPTIELLVQIYFKVFRYVIKYDVGQCIRITYYFVKNNKVSIKDSARLIASIDSERRANLPDVLSDIIIIADMVCEEEDEGFCTIDHDDVFFNSLVRVFSMR